MSGRARKMFSWADPSDREKLGLGLMDEGRVLALDWLIAGSQEERRRVEAKALRLFVRLAAIEVVDAREEFARRRQRARRNDQLVIGTLGRMADALDAAHADFLAGGDGRAHVAQALTAANVLRAEGLLGWFSYGPYAGLQLVAGLLAEQRAFDFGVVDDLQTLAWCTREIPAHEMPLGGDAECSTFHGKYDGFLSTRVRGG